VTAPRTEPSAPSQAGGCVPKAIICEETTRVCAARYGHALRAIVLTGSLARDEATFVEEGSSWRLLGDADFFLVFPSRSRLPSQLEIDSASREIEDALRKRALVGSVGLAPVDIRYLRGLPNHISPYELRTCGQVLWGERDVLSQVPEFEPAQLSLEDAWRLLANRIIELLEAVASAGNVDAPQVQYRVVKLFLDMATSYLVFAGRYCPTYRGREQALRSMADETGERSDRPFQFRSFAGYVSACTRFKTEGYALTVAPAVLWEDAVQFARLLWKWELSRLTATSGQLQASALMSRWMSHQTTRAKVRGWASILRRSGWWRSCGCWLHWARIARTSSPRYWVYHVASELLLALPDRLATPKLRCLDAEPDWDGLARYLPSVTQPMPEFGDPAWAWLARETASNYHRFLETTLA
jgi:hypothetical protein